MNQEPAVIIGAVATLVVAIASVFDIVIDADELTKVVVSALPIVTAFLIRPKVSPAP